MRNEISQTLFESFSPKPRPFESEISFVQLDGTNDDRPYVLEEILPKTTPKTNVPRNVM